MDCGSVLPLVSIFQRYESAGALRLFRTLHELERLQRMRRGEHLSAPAAVDVTVHAEPHGPDSFGESSDKPVLEGSQAERRDEEEEESHRSRADGARPEKQNSGHSRAQGE